MTRHVFRVGLVLTGLLLVRPAAAGPLLGDPVGDTFGVLSPQLDIVSSSGDFNSGPPTTYVFKVNFTGPRAPASAFAPNSVVGFIDIDADQNAATGGSAPFGGPVPGGNSWINVFILQGQVPGPTINLGDEFFLDLGSEQFHPGQVDVVRASTNVPTGQAPRWPPTSRRRPAAACANT
jgi:hypothetical protein